MVKYTVDLGDYKENSIKVSLLLDVLKGIHKFILPNWRPGRYSLSNYFERIVDLRASFNSQLIHVKWEAHNILELKIPSDGQLIIEFHFKSDVLTAGDTFIDEDFAIVNPINFSLYNDKFKNDEVQLVLLNNPFDDFRGDLIRDSQGVFKFDNYLELIDSPFFLGNEFLDVRIEVENVPFYLHFNKEVGGENQIQLISDFKKMIKAQLEFFEGFFPRKSYCFLIYSPSVPFYHGVEHLGSTVIILGPANQLLSEKYSDLLGVASHELFHVWNAGMLKPKELCEGNYDKPVIFSTGWFIEGITTYLGDKLLWKAGVISNESFQEELNLHLFRHYMNPSRLFQSLEDASVQLWDKGYSRNHPPIAISIYTEGAIVALILDLKIQRLSKSKNTIALLMNNLIPKVKSGALKGYTSENLIQEIAGVIGGDEANEFYTQCIKESNKLIATLQNELKMMEQSYQMVDHQNSITKNTGIIFYNENGLDLIKWIWPESGFVDLLEIGDELVSHIETDKHFQLTFKRNGNVIPIKFEKSEKKFFDYMRITLPNHLN